MATVSLDNLDPFRPEFQQDSFPYYALMRETSPAWHLPGTDLHFITRYDLVSAALKDTATFSSAYGATANQPPKPHLVEQLEAIRRQGWVRPPTMLTVDPPDHTRMSVVRRAFWAVYDCPVPVVAAVNGAALGTGLALAACSDVIVASERATFGLPELEVGVLGGVKFAARLVPELAVRRLFLTAERVSARRFVEMGAALAVVPVDELEEATRAVVAEITAKSSVALRFAKQAMNAVEHMDLKPGYEYEQTFTIRMAERAEAKEAVRSVLEKRPLRMS